MQKLLKDYLDEVNKKQKQRRRSAIALTLVAVMLISTVAWNLTEYGVAMTGDPKCGLEEHTHSDACYEDVLICGQEESEGHTHTDACHQTETQLTCGQEESEEHTHDESCYTTVETYTCGQEESEGHTHTDACYERQLVCGMEEHTHSDACFIDTTADVEDASVWNAQYADTQWKDIWGEDLAAAAKKQIGYKESTDNYTVAGDESHKGYTRYGQFAGDVYADWDAAFVNFCVYYAGLEASHLFPTEIETAKWYDRFAQGANKDYLTAPAEYEPQTGDIVFFQREHEETDRQMGIVSSYDKNKNEIKVIEGNSDNTVKENRYTADNKNITAYLKITELEDAYKNGKAVQTEEDADEEPVAEELNYEDDEISVKVTAAEAGIIPEGAELKVVPITKENAETESQYQDVEAKLQEKAAEDEYNIIGFLAYDISLVDADGNKAEPNGEVKVAMDYKEAAIPQAVVESEIVDAEVNVLHLEEDASGEVTQVVDMSMEEKATVDTLTTTEGAKVQSVEIATESFSTYTITWKKDHKLSVKLVDEAGNEIGVDSSINIEKRTKVEDLAPEIIGYAFRKATIRSKDKEKEISELLYDTDKNEWRYIEKGDDDKESVGNKQIYFVYGKNSEGLIDLHGTPVSPEEYRKLAEDAEAAAGDVTQGRLPITWTRSDSVYNSSERINTTWNWDTLMKSIGNNTLSITDSNEIWDGSRSLDGITSIHKFTNYLPSDKITVYKNGDEERKMYDSATWKLDGKDSYYRFRGTFDLKSIALDADDTYADYDYTIESVLKDLDNKIYINDNMYVFVYPTDVTLNNDNFMDYLAFWTGTSNQEGEVKFHDRQGTKANRVTDNMEGTFREITDGWYTDPVTDGAGGIIQNALNTGHSTSFYIDVIGNDYADGGAIYRLQIGAAKQHKTEVGFYKVSSQDINRGVEGAKFTLTNNANPGAYRPLESDENGYVKVKVKPGTYTLRETATVSGYEKTENTWTVTVTDKGFTMELNGASDGKAELGQYTTGDNNGKYYITNLATEPEPEPDPTPEKELTKSKTVTKRQDSKGKEDGTYDLELTVSGAVGNKTKKAQLDILLIIDKSSSMSGNKLPSAKTAAKNLVSTIQGNEGIDAKYAVVSFSGILSDGTPDPNNDPSSPGKSTKINQSWTADANSAKTAIDSIALGRGTNYQAAFMTAEEVLQGARTNAEKVVIFLTDGDPYHWVNKTEYASGTNNNGYTGGTIEQALTHAKDEIKNVYCDQFYAIAAYGGSTTRLTELKDLVGGDNKRPEKSGVYKADNATELDQVFKDIAANVTSVLCDHVTVTDTLSQYVEPVLSDSKIPITITVTKTVTKADGTTEEQIVGTGTDRLTLSKTETNSETTITAAYDETTKELTLNFPETYKLEPDYIYKVTMPIQPTEKAYSDYRTNGLEYPTVEGNPVKGDPATGTHAGETGFYSNDSATVTYTYNGESKTENYDKPVVQIHPSTLVIEKTINGELKEEELQSLIEKLTFNLKLTNGKKVDGDTFYNDRTLNLDAAGLVYDEVSKKYVYTLSGLSPDTKFEVNETGYNMDGYTCTTTATGQKGELELNEGFTIKDQTISGSTSSLYDVINTPENAENTVSYVNEYANNSAVLDLKKVGTDNNFLPGAEFALEKKTGDDTWEPWKAEENAQEVIEVKNEDEEIEYSGLPTGYYRLEEKKAPGGFLKLDDYIYFKVDRGVISLTDEDGNDVETSADSKWNLTGPDENKVYVLTVQNDAVYDLPSAGGPGIYWYIFGGVLLMAAALLMLYKNKCKEITKG
ncbi:MAG: DUF7604 domain-containing protein [Lachnospiraceae bacterium]|jgi:hypothetical protein